MLESLSSEDEDSAFLGMARATGLGLLFASALSMVCSKGRHGGMHALRISVLFLDTWLRRSSCTSMPCSDRRM